MRGAPPVAEVPSGAGPLVTRAGSAAQRRDTAVPTRPRPRFPSQTNPHSAQTRNKRDLSHFFPAGTSVPRLAKVGRVQWRAGHFVCEDEWLMPHLGNKN